MAEQDNYLSPNQKAWRRLRRNKSALFGMVIIFAALFAAAFGYLLAPDPTPDADEQILQINTKEPGFEIDILKRRKNREVPQRNFLSRMWSGQENAYEYIPINSFVLRGDSVDVNIYTGNKSLQDFQSFALAELLFALAPESPVIKSGDSRMIRTTAGESFSLSVNELQEQFESDSVVKKSYWLGTDKFGRDNLSRILLGVRVSLMVGIISVLVSLLIGITLGAIAGYFRGWVDDLVMYIINVFWSIPLLLWVFMLVFAFDGREFNLLLVTISKNELIYLAVGLVMWVEIARIVRGQFFSLREKEFVEASKSLGYSHWRTIFKHILPNAIGPIIVITAANFASAIIIEAGLSFLGIGVQPPKPSWGSILNEYYKYIGTSKSFLAIIPGVCIMLLTLGFNLLGNGVRDALDIKSTL